MSGGPLTTAWVDVEKDQEDFYTLSRQMMAPLTIVDADVDMKPLRSPYSSLVFLRLLEDDSRALFLPAVAEQLCAASPAADVADVLSLSGVFHLNFRVGKPAALLHGAKMLLCRVASAAYVFQRADSAAGLHTDLVGAGLDYAAATWVCDAAEAAVLPVAADLRLAQSRVAACGANDCLQDFDWSLWHVFSSSTIAREHVPLVHLELCVLKVRARL